MPKIDIASLPVDTNTNYPDPFWKVIVGRERKRLKRIVRELDETRAKARGLVRALGAEPA